MSLPRPMAREITIAWFASTSYPCGIRSRGTCGRNVGNVTHFLLGLYFLGINRMKPVEGEVVKPSPLDPNDLFFRSCAISGIASPSPQLAREECRQIGKITQELGFRTRSSDEMRPMPLKDRDIHAVEA